MGIERAAGPFDVITMGRVSADIYPLEIGVRLEHVTRFGKYLGGSATNVAVAAARHGLRSAIITRTGEDPFGRFVHLALRDLGVDDCFVSSVPDLLKPVVFYEILPPDDFPLYFYREPKAPDLEIRSEELDLDAIRAAGIFWITGTGLSQEPSRYASWERALGATGVRGLIVGRALLYPLSDDVAAAADVATKLVHG